MPAEPMRYLSASVVGPQLSLRAQRRVADLFHAFFERLRRPGWRLEVTWSSAAEMGTASRVKGTAKQWKALTAPLRRVTTGEIEIGVGAAPGTYARLRDAPEAALSLTFTMVVTPLVYVEPGEPLPPGATRVARGSDWARWDELPACVSTSFSQQFIAEDPGRVELLWGHLRDLYAAVEGDYAHACYLHDLPHQNPWFGARGRWRVARSDLHPWRAALPPPTGERAAVALVLGPTHLGALGGPEEALRALAPHGARPIEGDHAGVFLELPSFREAAAPPPPPLSALYR
jgi:hypothetical protein